MLRKLRRAWHATLAEYHARAMNRHIRSVLRLSLPFDPDDMHGLDLTDAERDAFLHALEDL